MRVLCTVSNWSSHFFPMVPLCWALRAAGHDVLVACDPGSVDALGNAGLTPVPVLRRADMVRTARLIACLSARSGQWHHKRLPPHPVTGRELGDLAEFDLDAYQAGYAGPDAEHVAAGVHALLDFAADFRPDVVLRDPMCPEGLLAARVLGVPALVHLWGPFSTEETVAARDFLPPPFAEIFAAHGVSAHDPNLPTYVIDPCPEGLRPPSVTPRLPIRHVPYHGPGAAPIPLPARGDRPRVLVTWSTSTTLFFGPCTFVVPAVLDACADVDADVDVMVGERDAELLPELPPNARLVRPYVPLHLVAHSVDLVVHHGGAGPALTCAAAGVPQLCLPSGFDQVTIAGRVAATGAGCRIDNHLADPAAITPAVRKLLHDPSFLEAATTLRKQTLTLPSPAELAGRLADMVSPA